MSSRRQNRQQTPDFQRFKMNQQYQIIFIIALLSEAARQSSTLNNTDKHSKWIMI